MSFSDFYLPILDQLKTDVETAWNFTSAEVFQGVPTREITTPHAVILVENITSSLSDTYASGTKPAGALQVSITGFFGLSDDANLTEYEYLFAFVDPLVALIEAGSTYQTAMLPEVTSVSMDNLTGYVDSTGQATFVVTVQVQMQVQRSRG